MRDRPRDVLRQGFEPVRVVPPQCHVEGDDILDVAAMDRAIAHRGTSCGEAVQEGLLALAVRAFEEGALRRRQDGFQKAPGLGYTGSRHFEHQMMLILIAILPHPLRQMLREEIAPQLHDPVAEIPYAQPAGERVDAGLHSEQCR
jgi:hypothetical protein